MATKAKSQIGPVLSLVVSRGQDNSLTWEVEIEADDATGVRRLGYRANGMSLVADANSGAFVVYVQDDLRVVWTPLPAEHRKDIRKAICAILLNASGSVAELGNVADS